MCYYSNNISIAARRAAFALHCVAAACTALSPVYENYTNDRLVFAMGSAEQNGHTFGWQFGNYQLRGANAIREELVTSLICQIGSEQNLHAPGPASCRKMVLPFPVLADYGFLLLGGRAVYLTHGHVINKAHPLPFAKGDILLHGHTHVPACEVREKYIYMNPGSVSIPKENSAHSYMTLENDTFLWKDLDGNVYREYSL